MKIIPGKRAIDLGKFLAQPLFAHLATVQKGVPRESSLWLLWEEQKLWFIGNRRTDTFPARLQAEPQWAVGIVFYDSVNGIVYHVGFRGHAEVQLFDLGSAKRLLKRYLGEQEEKWVQARFVEPFDDVDMLLVCFTPETMVARDQSYSSGL